MKKASTKTIIAVAFAAIAVITFIVEVILTALDNTREFTLGAVIIIAAAMGAIITTSTKKNYESYDNLPPAKRIRRIFLIALGIALVLGGIIVSYVYLN